MTDPTEEESQDEIGVELPDDLLLADGEIWIPDPHALCAEFDAIALCVRDYAIFVMQSGTRKFVALEAIKKRIGNVRVIRDRPPT